MSTGIIKKKINTAFFLSLFLSSPPNWILTCRRRNMREKKESVVIVSKMLDLSIFNPNTQCKTQPPICLRAFKACDYSTESLRSADVWMLCSIRCHLHFGSPKNQVGIKKKWSKHGMGGFCLNLSDCTFIRHLELASLWNAYDKKQKNKKPKKKCRAKPHTALRKVKPRRVKLPQYIFYAYEGGTFKLSQV